MGRTLVLEDFGGPLDALTAAGRGAALPEEQRLAAFEDGYQAGWDDAARALSESHQKLSADLAQNLGDLAFTFHEARAHVLKGVEPLLRQMVSRILPDVARHALPGLVVEMLQAGHVGNPHEPDKPPFVRALEIKIHGIGLDKPILGPAGRDKQAGLVRRGPGLQKEHGQKPAPAGGIAVAEIGASLVHASPGSVHDVNAGQDLGNVSQVAFEL